MTSIAAHGQVTVATTMRSRQDAIESKLDLILARLNAGIKVQSVVSVPD